jgi:hypothetical protein
LELNFDWHGYRKTFGTPPLDAKSQLGVTWLVTERVGDQELIHDGLGGIKDAAEWKGRPVSEFKSQHPHERIKIVPRASLRGTLVREIEAAQHTHLGEQLSAIAQDLVKHVGISKDEIRLPSHFITESFRGALGKILPSSYGLLIRQKEGDQFEDFIVLVRRGRVAAFHRPDLSFLSVERKKSEEEIVKYLSEKYLVPFQGIFVPTSVFRGWSASATPWKNMAASVRSGETTLAPFRWSVSILVGFKAALGL